MEEENVLTQAYEEGQKRLDSKGAFDKKMSGDKPIIGTGGIYDPRTSPDIAHSFSSLTVDPRLKPGQYFNHYGTTVMNPLRSSKEVEAVLGEKKYNPAVEEKSPEQMRVKQFKLENEVDTLKKQVEILVSALQKQANNKPIEETPLEGKTVSVLRNEAKEKGLPYVGKNKAKLIEILTDGTSET